MPTLDADSIDSCVCDPPYHLTSVVQRFGKEGSAPAKYGTDGAYSRASAGFMGKKWDGGEIAFKPETWAEVYRVLKPGAFLLAFGGTRTYHRLACAIEDAGFDIRGTILWHFGQGFPKSHDVSKGIDRAAGAQREVIGSYEVSRDWSRQRSESGDSVFSDRSGGGTTASRTTLVNRTVGATDFARQWSGWGTALKPATEIVCYARKPLSEKTVAANVLRWGTGALNIDACRIESEQTSTRLQRQQSNRVTWSESGFNPGHIQPMFNALGRWPADLIHDGSEVVTAGFPRSLGFHGGGRREGLSTARNVLSSSFGNAGEVKPYGDDGSAARFFYHAKATKSDRAGSRHPTVKPVALIRYLVRLVTQPGGTVLDPFAGSGTTGAACEAEGFDSILIEAEPEYQADIERRFGVGGLPAAVRRNAEARRHLGAVLAAGGLQGHGGGALTGPVQAHGL